MLYFRSLKATNVLNLLTKYLLQYRTVTIPHVGTIHIVQQSPQLYVADKLIQPPSFSAQLKEEEQVPAHQLNFLASKLEKRADLVLEELKNFGDQLNDRINGSGFEWSGFGWIDSNTQSFVIPAAGLNAVIAERVMRHNPDHQVLVGDRQTSSYELADEKAGIEGVKNKRSVAIVVGWILLILSILIIAFFIYQGKFRVNATGSKQWAWQHVNDIEPHNF